MYFGEIGRCTSDEIGQEDLGYISDKYGYRSQIGRPKQWRSDLISEVYLRPNDNIETILKKSIIDDPTLIRRGELLISLITGSINDITAKGAEVPQTILEKIKKKIILFDGDQTRFVFGNDTADEVRIQGISGAGKTELLLHKLKELYVLNRDSKIVLTCHNKILADSLRKRIPDFFNFMKVEQQIEWNERLWCVHGWGSGGNPNSGTYSFICNYYDLNFNSYGNVRSFEEACSIAIKELKSKDNFEPFFDYILIDESQDFSESFFDLCKLVTKHTVFIAGDIFQSIFDLKILDSVEPKYLLKKCYRTDPRTLMFSHMVGMGWVEKSPLRWLEDKELDACGYVVKKQGKTYNLSREPLRRFEDIDDSQMQSVTMESFSNDLVTQIVNTIAAIKDEFPDVQPDDVGILFADVNKAMYAYGDQISLELFDRFEWEVNKAYESKEKKKNSVFVSNRNHAKGLEFPFVICVASNITGSYSYRNALYMLISRSFIKTYFLVAQKDSHADFIESATAGWEQIYTEGRMSIVEPSEEVKNNTRTTIIKHNERLSLHQLIVNAFDQAKATKKERDKVGPSAMTMFSSEEYGDEEVERYINSTLNILRGK